jgi:hypothetical protein
MGTAVEIICIASYHCYCKVPFTERTINLALSAYVLLTPNKYASGSGNMCHYTPERACSCIELHNFEPNRAVRENVYVLQQCLNGRWGA